MVGRVVRRARQFADDLVRRRLDRIADGEVDHVDAGGPGLADLLPQFREEVRSWMLRSLSRASGHTSRCIHRPH
jgi:hypothetical protein